jgi:hypothetical protein
MSITFEILVSENKRDLHTAEQILSGFPTLCTNQEGLITPTYSIYYSYKQ